MSDTSLALNTTGRARLLLIASLLAATGLIMALHGLGVISAQWLNPNPHTPSWVFTIIGIVLLLGAWLTVISNRAVPGWLRNGPGIAVSILALVMMHWLVFFSVGGSCGAETGSLAVNLPSLACRGIMGAAVTVLDLILLAVAFATLRSRRHG